MKSFTNIGCMMFPSGFQLTNAVLRAAGGCADGSH
jgi:hypothetical protein